MGTDMDEVSKEFLLEEYKAAWEMVKYLSQQRDKWMKYYFTIIAAVFSYIGVTLKLSYDKSLEKNPCLYKKSLLDILQQIFQNDYIASIPIIFLLSLLVIIGITTFLTTLQWRKQSTEYYRTLNLIRSTFINHKSKKFHIDNYIFLPTDPKKALRWKGIDFLTTLLLTLINAVVFTILVDVFIILRTNSISTFSFILVDIDIVDINIALIIIFISVLLYFYKKVLKNADKEFDSRIYCKHKHGYKK